MGRTGSVDKMDYGSYAVSITAMMELTREPAGLPLLLLLKGIVTETVIWPVRDKEWAHQAFLVSDEVTAERWEAIVALIRGKFRYAQFPLYEKGARGWKTIR